MLQKPTKMNITQEQEDAMNERQNIIGRNGNDGLHYDAENPENTTVDIREQLRYMKALNKEAKLYESIHTYIVANNTSFEEEYQLILNKTSGLSGRQRSYLKALQEYEPTQAELDAHEARSKRIADYEAENE